MLLSPELHSKQPITVTAQTSARKNPPSACYARLGHLLRWQLAGGSCWQQGCQPLSRAISEEPEGHPEEQDTQQRRCVPMAPCAVPCRLTTGVRCSPPLGLWSSELGEHVLSMSDRQQRWQRQLFLALTLPAALCCYHQAIR